MTMFAKFCLFTCVLSMGQVADHGLWQLTPQFGRGQELVYSGSFIEESLGGSVEYHRRYRLETRAVVLEAGPRNWSIAILTSLKVARTRPGQGPAEKNDPGAVRLEVVDVDQRGRATSPTGADLQVALDGPPTIELGCLFGAPQSRVGRHHQWAAAERGRPPISWAVLGTEVLSSTVCVKMEGKQQSPEWLAPRADRAGWQRTELVWLAPQSGIVYRVKRVIDRRDAGHEQPTQRLTVQYELVSQWASPPNLFEDRHKELLQIAQFSQEAEKCVAERNPNKVQLQALLQRIDHYLQKHQGEMTPQRRCLEQVKHRIEAVSRGEVTAVPATSTPLIPVARLGERAPDFLVTDLVSKQSVELYRLLGRPIVIFFFNPKSATGERVLNFVIQLERQYKSQVTFLGMAVTDDVAFVRKQSRDLGLSFRILEGKGLHHTFGVTATPRLLLLDSEGVLRASYTGWGYEVPGQLATELRRCLAAGQQQSQ
jgi:hypothetical protein